MDYIQFIKDWKLNKSLIAKKIGMPLGTFSNKISDNPVYKFTIEEENKILAYLRDLGFKATSIGTSCNLLRPESIPIKSKASKKLFAEFLTSDMKAEEFTKELKLKEKPLSRIDQMKKLRK